jgi:hypothetical protein
MSMNVNGVTSGAANSPAPKPTANNNVNNNVNSNVNNSGNNGNNSGPAAVYERSNGASARRPDNARLSEIRSAVNQSTERLRELVTRLLNQQGQSWSNAFNVNMIDIDDATRAEAASLVAEDGFWGVEQTAQRIFDFAQSLAGGDPARAELLMGAVEQGFRNAERAWGGELPEISRNTLSRVRELFSEWQAGPAAQ